MANKSYTESNLGTGSSATNAVGQTSFGPFTFDYINTGDIKFAVKVSGTWKFVTVASVNTTTKIITLSAAPSANPTNASAYDTFRIYRATTMDPLVDFQGGSRISEADLDNAYRQGLFAAQEVSEDANTSGGSGTTTLTTDSVQLVHMTNDSVDTAELKNDSVTADKIDTGAVGATELANTLNLSGKSVTLQNGEISADELASTLDLSGKTLTLPTKGGEVLECIQGICDGSQVPKASGGAYTMPSIKVGGTPVVQAATDTFAKVTGSDFTYTPPAEASRISYEFSFLLAPDAVGSWDGGKQAYSSPTLAHFRLMLDGTEVTKARFSAGTAHFYGDRVHFKWVFTRGGQGSVATDSSIGYFQNASDWTGGKEIKLEVKRYGTTNEGNSDFRYAQLHRNFWFDDNAYNSEATDICYPTLTITATK